VSGAKVHLVHTFNAAPETLPRVHRGTVETPDVDVVNMGDVDASWINKAGSTHYLQSIHFLRRNRRFHKAHKAPLYWVFAVK
jgi:hypothetical protein